MTDIRTFITETYVNFKTHRIFKELDKLSVSCPISSDEIENVLVILPRDVDYVDAAVSLVRDLRDHFSHWKFMKMDIDKIMHQKLNRLHLPNQNFLDELNQKNFQLALDLNFEFDYRVGYLLAMLKIPYRLHLNYQNGRYYNIVLQIDYDSFTDFDYVRDYLKTIFVAKELEES